MCPLIMERHASYSAVRPRRFMRFPTVLDDHEAAGCRRLTCGRTSFPWRRDCNKENAACLTSAQVCAAVSSWSRYPTCSNSWDENTLAIGLTAATLQCEVKEQPPPGPVLEALQILEGRRVNLRERRPRRPAGPGRLSCAGRCSSHEGARKLPLKQQTGPCNRSHPNRLGVKIRELPMAR